MILRQLISTYLAENPRVKSQHTERLLETSAKHFGDYLGREPCVADLADRNIVAYVRHREHLGKAKATVEREASKLMTLRRFAASYGWIEPPRIKIEKAPVAEPVAFLRREVRALFREAAKYDTAIGGAPGNRLLLALLYTIWDTAERVGALCEVERKDFQIVRWRNLIIGGWVTIRSRKNGGRPMVRKLRRSTARALAKHFDACPHRKPFGGVHRGTLYHHLEKLLERSGLPTSRRHKFHCLRKSHASYLHIAGGDSRESLGHSDASITRTHYFDPRVTVRKHAIDFLFDPLGFWYRLARLFRL